MLIRLLSFEIDIIGFLYDNEINIKKNSGNELTVSDLSIKLERETGKRLNYQELSERIRHLARHGLIICSQGHQNCYLLRLSEPYKRIFDELVKISGVK